MVYHGEIVRDKDGNPIRGNWSGYVSIEDFERISASRTGPPAPRDPGRPVEGYVLAKVAMCECGAGMDCITTRYRRVDGTRSKRYVCRRHRKRPQDCDRAPIDARRVDEAFVANLDSFLGDVTGWRERLAHDRQTERDRMAMEVQRAHKALEDTELKLSRLESKWESYVAADDDASADAALPVVIRCRDESDRATTRLRAATDALSSVADDNADNIDPLLDFFNGLRRELSGRVNSATDMKRLNAVIKEFFSEVVLVASDNGVLIAPYLHADAVERVLGERGLAPDADGFPDGLNIGHPPPLRALRTPSGNPRPL